MRILIRPKPAATAIPSDRLDIRPATIAITARPLRVLDFDIENRPLSYLGSDFTTAEVTAIAWAWTDRPDEVTCHLLGQEDLKDILREFVVAYAQADLVVGHYLRAHDIPMVNGALVELGLPVLPDKLVRDTKLDFVRTKGISLSQESLGAMLRLDCAKIQMNQARWRAANRLTEEGLALVRERVVSDVRQHMEMMKELQAKGYLGAPRWWRGGAAALSEGYTP